MNRSRLVSTFRVEFRRKGASYRQERMALRWVQKFLDEFAIDHSSQVRHWQCDYFLSNLKKDESSFDDLLQAKSAIRFLMKQVLKRSGREESEFAGHSPADVIRITA